MGEAYAAGSVDVEKVRKLYGNTEVLRDVSLNISAGSFVTLLGPSGCGKTTLLRLIAGFIEPSEGVIRINGTSMAGVPTQNRSIGMVFQNLALFPHLSVFENVAYGLRLRRRPSSEIERRVGRFIDLVGLQGLTGRRIGQLSGGQKQRVALARSLVLEPAILLLDEPLSALDMQLKKLLQLELKRIQRSLGTTFIYVTHDQDEATVMSDTIVVMNKGELQQIGTPRQIYEMPRSYFVSRFIGDINAVVASLTQIGADAIGITFDGISASLPKARYVGSEPPTAGERCYVCFRPEDVTIQPPDMPPAATTADALALNAQVDEVLPLGGVARIGLTAGGRTVTALLMTRDLDGHVPTPRSMCRLAIAANKIHVFPVQS